MSDDARVPVLRIGECRETPRRAMTPNSTATTRRVMDDAALRGRIRAIVTRSPYPVAPARFERLPALAIVATSGVGCDGIPLAAARERGIVVTHTPGVLDAAVAELAVGLLLAPPREIPARERHLRDGGWARTRYPLTMGLAGERVGIVGLGRIGPGIAARLAPFGMELAYRGRRPVPHAYFPDAAALAEQVDILVVGCPGGAATRHRVDARVLAGLGQDGFLVNVARGPAVDEAALDVFETAPLVDSPLLTMPNCVRSPHAGSATVETRRIMLRLMLDNVHRVPGGEPAPTLV
ncbi:NAD(P)-dependent oxidoreductase [Burkholderia plantarii]|uniref:NAD(P)-dependent oxidoreductase n=1 Tax=Burkholderia plantarii TaxID=41899 RepID=UPI000870914C|nr:NAD(P)-dependent oxidoreductase [Burkholderia plantarii]